ncbi:hypothetical protein BGZ58_006676 [Dissophora ornata]|nr:hypothetical protein BGZ58_006676 [Dissophora ornata]
MTNEGLSRSPRQSAVREMHKLPRSRIPTEKERLLSNKEAYDDPVPPSSAHIRRKASVKFLQIEDEVTEWFFKYQHRVNMTGEFIRKMAGRMRDNLDISEVEFKAPTGAGES